MAPMHRTYELLIILAALAAMAFAALRATQGRKANDVSEYFLGKREVGWLTLGASLFVTSVWTLWSFILMKPVAPGVLGWLVPGVVLGAAFVVLGIGFVPQFKESGASTLPSFLADRFGTPVGSAVALASIALGLFISIPFTLVVGTQLVTALMGWDPMSSGLLMVVVPGLFVVAGGFRSAMALQSAGSVAAGIGLIFLAVNGFPGGDGILHRFFPQAVASWPMLIVTLAILGVWLTCIEQQMVQRVLAARSAQQGRTGSLVAAVLVLLAVVALTAGWGDGNPSGPAPSNTGTIEGFLVAAVIAFAMSSLSAQFMSISTLMTMNVVRPAQQAAGPAALVLIGRLTSTVVVILAILTASSIPLIEPVLREWMIPVIAVSVPPIVAVVILGVFVPRMHGRGAFWALVTGWAAGIVEVSLYGGPDQMAENVFVTFAVAAVVFVSVSLTVAPLGALRKVPGTILQVRKP